jgi:hypothetical protein
MTEAVHNASPPFGGKLIKTLKNMGFTQTKSWAERGLKELWSKPPEEGSLGLPPRL